MPAWHLMSWEQARMKMIDGQAISYSGFTRWDGMPYYLMLVKPGSPLDNNPNGEPYDPTTQDLQRNNWETYP